MKICLLGPTYPYRGGIAHYTTLLCRELRKSHAVKFISFKRQYPAFLFPGKSDKDTSDEGIRVDDVDYLLDSMNPLSWLRTARAIVRFKPDLLVLPWWVAFWTAPFWVICSRVRRHGIKVVFICHNVVEHESSVIKRWCAKTVLRLGERFVVHSREDRDNLVAALPGADVVVNHHPTYADLSGQRIPKDEAKKRLGLAGPVILFFGFVRQYKGLGVLLDAMALIRRRQPEAVLLVVGEFWKDKADYLKQIEDLGIADRVTIMDHYVPNEEIPLYFGAADVVACPYLSVTGSGVVQTAFGFGRPVVATRVGCLPEVVVDGLDGRIVPPGDAGALAQALGEMLDGGRWATYTANAEKAKERFLWGRLVEAIMGDGRGGGRG
jgi:glycosyltransferase involved in cell wall biosynthesis